MADDAAPTTKARAGQFALALATAVVSGVVGGLVPSFMESKPRLVATATLQEVYLPYDTQRLLTEQHPNIDLPAAYWFLIVENRGSVVASDVEIEVRGARLIDFVTDDVAADGGIRNVTTVSGTRLHVDRLLPGHEVRLHAWADSTSSDSTISLLSAEGYGEVRRPVRYDPFENVVVNHATLASASAVILCGGMGAAWLLLRQRRGAPAT